MGCNTAKIQQKHVLPFMSLKITLCDHLIITRVTPVFYTHVECLFVVTGHIKTSWHPTWELGRSRRSYRNPSVTLWCEGVELRWGGYRWVFDLLVCIQTHTRCTAYFLIMSKHVCAWGDTLKRLHGGFPFSPCPNTEIQSKGVRIKHPAN